MPSQREQRVEELMKRLAKHIEARHRLVVAQILIDHNVHIESLPSVIKAVTLSNSKVLKKLYHCPESKLFYLQVDERPRLKRLKARQMLIRLILENH